MGQKQSQIQTFSAIAIVAQTIHLVAQWREARERDEQWFVMSAGLLLPLSLIFQVAAHIMII